MSAKKNWKYLGIPKGQSEAYNRNPTLEKGPSSPTVILMVGLQGAGKTTTAAKLARRLGREGPARVFSCLHQSRLGAGRTNG